MIYFCPSILKIILMTSTYKIKQLQVNYGQFTCCGFKAQAINFFLAHINCTTTCTQSNVSSGMVAIINGRLLSSGVWLLPCTDDFSWICTLLLHWRLELQTPHMSKFLHSCPKSSCISYLSTGYSCAPKPPQVLSKLLAVCRIARCIE